MDTRAFLGLTATHNPYRWFLPVEKRISTSGNFLFGGCALGAAVAAIEATTGRTCVWTTAQYLSYARPGEVMDIDVIVAVAGNQITQARAIGHVGEREIITVNAALGSRAFEHTGQFVTMPEVPAPTDCPKRESLPRHRGTFHESMEERMVKMRPERERDETLGDGRSIMWARIPSVLDGVDAAALAVLGDFVPMAIGEALGIIGGGNSLDNTLRVAQLVPTDWVLLDIHVHSVHNGFGHGNVHMFAEDGTLMAVASQSCIVRKMSLDHKPKNR